MKAYAVLVVALVPEVAAADSGEGLIELLLLQALRFLNLVWPFLVPLGQLGRARKKLSIFLYSLGACGALAWLLTYIVPQQLLEWLNPELTVANLRIGLVFMLFVTVTAVFLGARSCRSIREFNDSHD